MSLFYQWKPKNFKDMVAIENISQNSFSWDNRDPEHMDFDRLNQMLSSEAFKNFPVFQGKTFLTICWKKAVTENWHTTPLN